ncbi:hypothetical protein WJX77_004519 [Trebouxia sp. C0004]
MHIPSATSPRSSTIRKLKANIYQRHIDCSISANARNHLATNYFSRTLSWIKLQPGQHVFFANMESRFVSSWSNFVCRARYSR